LVSLGGTAAGLTAIEEPNGDLAVSPSAVVEFSSTGPLQPAVDYVVAQIGPGVGRLGTDAPIDVEIVDAAPSSPMLAILQTLDDRDIRHAAALTHCLQSIALSAGFKGVQQCRHESRSGAAERMTQSNCSTVDVEAGRIGVCCLKPR
jgi:hypothetical protein